MEPFLLEDLRNDSSDKQFLIIEDDTQFLDWAVSRGFYIEDIAEIDTVEYEEEYDDDDVSLYTMLKAYTLPEKSAATNVVCLDDYRNTDTEEFVFVRYGFENKDHGTTQFAKLLKRNIDKQIVQLVKSMKNSSGFKFNEISFKDINFTEFLKLYGQQMN